MSLTDLWLQFKEFFIDLVKYGFPTVALIVSIVSFKDSRKANKVQYRLNEVEEKLKKYELEEKEKEREEEKKACVEARIVNISKDNYILKVWNSGKATAYNVDFEIPEDHKGIIWREKVPYEFLESGKSFQEHVILCMGSPKKFKIITKWENEQGNSYSKEELLTF
jgi:hypothetical protein